MFGGSKNGANLDLAPKRFPLSGIQNQGGQIQLWPAGIEG